MQIHFVLQGKGGVGKSFVAALLAQHAIARKQPPLCIETDPVNRSLSRYSAFEVDALNLMEEKHKLARFFKRVSDREATAPLVVDSGASSFLPLSRYMFDHKQLKALRTRGHNVFLHTVIAGGAAIQDTGRDLETLCRHFPKTAIVVWLNPYFGPLEKDGTTFERTALYAQVADHIHGLVHLPRLQRETFGRDLSAMLTANQTFAEAEKNPAFTMMQRQRLAQTRRWIFAEMEKARL